MTTLSTAGRRSSTNPLYNGGRLKLYAFAIAFLLYSILSITANLIHSELAIGTADGVVVPKTLINPLSSLPHPYLPFAAFPLLTHFPCPHHYLCSDTDSLLTKHCHAR